jgi:uncharacterized protein (TIGR02246 family)
MIRTTLPLVLAVALGASPLAAASSPPALSPQDLAAVRTLNLAYPAAWLQNDPAAVKRLFAEDAVLLPADGHEPVRGMAAIEAFFWPPGSAPWRVLEYRMEPAEVSGHGDVAYAWGTLALSFADPQDAANTASSTGTYMMVARRQPDGTWKLARYMWDTRAVSKK